MRNLKITTLLFPKSLLIPLFYIVQWQSFTIKVTFSLRFHFLKFYNLLYFILFLLSCFIVLVFFNTLSSNFISFLPIPSSSLFIPLFFKTNSGVVLSKPSVHLYYKFWIVPSLFSSYHFIITTIHKMIKIIQHFI